MYQVLCTKEKHKSWMHLRHVLSVHQIFRWASFYRPTVCVCVRKFLTFLLCIIIESIAADFYKDSCCVSLHKWGLSITCDFCLFYSLTPMKNVGSDGERMKSFIPPDIFIFLLYILVVYYVLPTFFSLLQTQFGNF